MMNPVDIKSDSVTVAEQVTAHQLRDIAWQLTLFLLSFVK